MAMIRKVVPAQVNALGDDEVEIVMSTAQLARDGHILLPQGCILDNYRSNPIILWQHDPEHPVGKASEIAIDGNQIRAKVTFAPAGISHKADEVRGLVKSGIVSGVSVGFDPIEGDPIDPKRPRGGQRFTQWELLECSFCSVPVDTGATVTARTVAESDWKVGAARDLEIEDSDSWDGSAAEKSIFAHAGGDDFDPAKARKGFLVYDASKPKERGSYKLPIAHVEDDKLVVPKGAIRAAASRLPQTDIPDDVKERAQAVLDHYKEKAGMSGDSKKDGDRSFRKFVTRMMTRDGKPKLKRGLYDVASLAYTLMNLGYAHDCALTEAAFEGDGSEVPGMLAEALHAVAEAFLAMTEEEVGELLGRLPGGGEDPDDDVETRDLPDEERAFIKAGKTPAIRAWRAGLAIARAGKVLSASNEKRLNTAADQHDRAMKQHKELGEHHDAAGGNMDAITAAQEKAGQANERALKALDAAKKNPDKAADHIDRAMTACRSAGDHMDTMGESCRAMADCYGDAVDAHRAMGRSVAAAQRNVRAVLDGSTTAAEDEDGDSRETQTSDGTGENSGEETRAAADFRRRQVDLLALAGKH